MMQKGSQNIPSVLRFRDHVEGLSLLQINAFSSLGKILLQTVAKLDISPILIGCLSGRFLELHHLSPDCILTEYSLYLGTFSI